MSQAHDLILELFPSFFREVFFLEKYLVFRYASYFKAYRFQDFALNVLILRVNLHRLGIS